MGVVQYYPETFFHFFAEISEIFREATVLQCDCVMVFKLRRRLCCCHKLNIN